MAAPSVRIIGGVVALAAATTLTSSANAEGFDGQRVAPAVGAAGGMVVERPLVPRHLGFGLGAFVGYAHRPVVLRSGATGDAVARPLAHALGLDLLGSIGLFNFMEIGVHVPVRMIHDGDDVSYRGQPLRARGGLGDMRVVPKFTFFDLGDESFHYTLGAAIPLTLPTGSASALRGDGAFALEPRLLFGLGGGRWDLVFSGGYRMRTSSPRVDATGGRELTFGGAFTYGLVTKGTPIDLQIEVYGAHLPSAASGVGKTPFEALGGVIVWPSKHLSLYALAGPGITEGVGTPTFRGIIGIRFGEKLPGRDRFRDSDGDGIRDDKDECPNEAEDKDNFQDEDGCPDPDNDHDGIPDDRDECPNQAEEPGGNGDGCPEKAQVIVRPGQVEVLGKVRFGSGSAEILKESDPLLDELAKAFKEHPEIEHVRIEGHTDDVGAPEVNQKLSKDRAESVKKALVARGVDAGRLETAGYGSSKPIAPNSSPAGRAQNRRVEFVVLPKK